MKLLTPIAFFFLMFSLFFTGCKKEKLEEKAKEPSNVPTGSTDDTENSDGTDEKEENDSPTDALKLFQRLTNGVLQGEKEIDVREFNISSDKADSLYNCFIRNNPLLFHLKVSGNIGYRVDLQHPEYLATFIPQYAVLPAIIHDIYPAMEEAIETFYMELDYRMTPAEIAYTLYQKLCKEIIYGERNEEYPNLAYSSFSALGAFITHKAVCQGYSLSLSLLLNGLGIQTEYVTGPIPGTSGHAWNRIYIDGNWYNADATFDDASSYNLTTISSINKYFLCSDELFYTTFEHAKPYLNLQEQIYTTSGNKFDSEKCVIRRFDTQGEIIKTEAIYANGYWYYLSTKNEKMKIIKSDFNGQHIKELRQQNIASTIGNVDKVQYTKDRIFFLDIIDGKYNICSIDYDGNDFRQEKRISFIEASSTELKLSQDKSLPVHDFRGIVALKSELMLAKLRLLYFHGDDDYFYLSQPQAQVLENSIKDIEFMLKNQHIDDTQANILAKEIKSKRKAYNLPISVKR